MDIVPLVVGSILAAGSLWFLFERRDSAGWLHEYYNSRPDPSWRPKWLLSSLRPSRGQTMAMVIAFSLIVFAFGVNGILLGLGVSFAVTL